MNLFQRLRWELFSTTKKAAYRRVWTEEISETEFWEAGKREAQQLSIYVTAESKVLDIGCGIGRVEKFLAPKCAEIDAVDISENMLRHARSEVKATNVHFRRCDATKLTNLFEPNTFDFIFTLNTLQHLAKDQALKVLKDVNALLKKTGIAFLHFLNSDAEHWKKISKKQRRLDPARIRLYNRDEIEHLMCSTGFNPQIRTDSNGTDFYVVASHAGVDLCS